jgi:hypothetical protein
VLLGHVSTEPALHLRMESTRLAVALEKNKH